MSTLSNLQAQLGVTVTFTGEAAAEVRRLAQTLGVTPEEMVTDAVALLKVAIDAGLSQHGRLTPNWPAMYALSYWSEISKRGDVRKIQASTKQGNIIYRPPSGTLGR